jgi:hypothetical protein
MSTRLSSTAESVWRATRGALVRLNHLLTETGNSDDDLVFQIRRSETDMRAGNPERTRRSERDQIDPSSC